MRGALVSWTLPTHSSSSSYHTLNEWNSFVKWSTHRIWSQLVSRNGYNRLAVSRSLSFLTVSWSPQDRRWTYSYEMTVVCHCFSRATNRSLSLLSVLPVLNGWHDWFDELVFDVRTTSPDFDYFNLNERTRHIIISKSNVSWWFLLWLKWEEHARKKDNHWLHNRWNVSIR